MNLSDIEQVEWILLLYEPKLSDWLEWMIWLGPSSRFDTLRRVSRCSSMLSDHVLHRFQWGPQYSRNASNVFPSSNEEQLNRSILIFSRLSLVSDFVFEQPWPASRVWTNSVHDSWNERKQSSRAFSITPWSILDVNSIQMVGAGFTLQAEWKPLKILNHWSLDEVAGTRLQEYLLGAGLEDCTPPQLITNVSPFREARQRYSMNGFAFFSNLW